MCYGRRRWVARCGVSSEEDRRRILGSNFVGMSRDALEDWGGMCAEGSPFLEDSVNVSGRRLGEMQDS